jgi:redox-sensitive bicupin YhaK (pirin superfamily)
VYGIEPGYQRKRFETRQSPQLIARPDAHDGSLKPYQNAFLPQLRLNADETVSHSLETGRTIYIRLVLGSVSVNRGQLNEGDGAAIKRVNAVNFIGAENSEVLVIDLP